MNLESPKISVSKSPEDVFDFLANVKNFESLMPENISKFEVLTEDTFVFALKGMPEIILKKKEVIPIAQMNETFTEAKDPGPGHNGEETWNGAAPEFLTIPQGNTNAFANAAPGSATFFVYPT